MHEPADIIRENNAPTRLSVRLSSRSPHLCSPAQMKGNDERKDVIHDQ